MEAAAVDDADGAMTGVAAVLDETCDARNRVIRRHAVEVQAKANRIVAALQPAKFTPIHAGRGECGVDLTRVVGGLLRRRALRAGEMSARTERDPVRSIALQRNHVRHCPRELVIIRIGGTSGLLFCADRACFLRPATIPASKADTLTKSRVTIDNERGEHAHLWPQSISALVM
jgi:hypothetical protein